MRNCTCAALPRRNGAISTEAGARFSSKESLRGVQLKARLKQRDINQKAERLLANTLGLKSASLGQRVVPKFVPSGGKAPARRLHSSRAVTVTATASCAAILIGAIAWQYPTSHGPDTVAEASPTPATPTPTSEQVLARVVLDVPEIRRRGIELTRENVNPRTDRVELWVVNLDEEEASYLRETYGPLVDVLPLPAGEVPHLGLRQAATRLHAANTR